MGAVWNLIHDLFEAADGSLPDIRITELTPEGVAKVYDYLRAHSRLACTNPHFWDKTSKQEAHVDSVPNAAQRVIEGLAEPFHIAVGGLKFLNTKIPDLGIFVFQKEIALDYRTGKEWAEPQLLALFELLRHICSIDPHARIKYDEGSVPDFKQRFQRAWSMFQRS